MSQQGAVLMPRSKPRSKSDRQAARLRVNRLTCAPRREFDPPSAHTLCQRTGSATAGIALDRDSAGLVNLGPLFPDHGEMDDGLDGPFHILPAYPFQPRMKRVLAGENIGAGQSHERQPRAV